MTGSTTDDGTVPVGVRRGRRRAGRTPSHPHRTDGAVGGPVGCRPETAASDAAWCTLARTLGAFALSRLVVAMGLGSVLVVNQGLATHHFTGPWPTPPRASLFLQALGSWDGSWYLLIAGHGYFPPRPTSPSPPGRPSGSSRRGRCCCGGCRR